MEPKPKIPQQLKRNLEEHTFRNINVPLEIVNVEAPKESRDEVDQGSTNVVTEPRLDEVRPGLPEICRQESAKNNTVIERCLGDEKVELIFHGEQYSGSAGT